MLGNRRGYINQESEVRSQKHFERSRGPAQNQWARMATRALSIPWLESTDGFQASLGHHPSTINTLAERAASAWIVANSIIYLDVF